MKRKSPSEKDAAEISSAPRRLKPITLKAMKPIWFAAAGLVLTCVAASAWLSPTWLPKHIVSGAETGDYSKLEKLVDFVAVRVALEADLKDGMGAAYRRKLVATGEESAMLSGHGMGNIDAFATTMAEQIATPATLEKAAKGEEIWIDMLGKSNNFLPEFRHVKNGVPGFLAEGRYLGLSRYEYRLRSLTSDRTFDVQMRRTGLLSWQVERIKVDPTLMASLQLPNKSPSETTLSESWDTVTANLTVENDTPPTFQDEQLYSSFRTILLKRGFAPIPQLHAEPNYFCGTENLDEGEPDLCAVYPEVEDCGGSGARPCNFLFRQMTDGRTLVVHTGGEMFEQITVTGTEWRD